MNGLVSLIVILVLFVFLIAVLLGKGKGMTKILIVFVVYITGYAMFLVEKVKQKFRDWRTRRKREKASRDRSNRDMLNINAQDANENPNVPHTTFADVAGNEEAKQELREFIEFLEDPERFAAMGAHMPKGILMIGPPGCGKTLLSRAMAGEAKRPFFAVSASEFVEYFVGAGAAKVRDLFLLGKNNAPSILFIDELDAVGRRRGAGVGQGSDEREQTLNQLFVEMDGFQQFQIIVIAATNRADVLDPALLRPGRFDRKVVIGLPDVKARKEILDVHARGKPMGEDVDLGEIAAQTSGLSGADLAAALNEAAIFAVQHNKEVIEMQDIEDGIDKAVMGPESKAVRLTDKEKRIVAYHESGHAIVAEKIPGSDPPSKITILSRGMALGHTKMASTEDRHLLSKEQALAQITVALGGHAAEEIFMESITTGASNDIEHASVIARKMVTEWGMGKLGPINVSTSKDHPFLGIDIAQPRNFSEATAKEIDKEVKEIISESLKRAHEIIVQHREKVERLAQELMKEETFTRQQIVAIIGEEESS